MLGAVAGKPGVVSALLASGASLAATDVNGTNMLMAAALYQRLEVRVTVAGQCVTVAGQCVRGFTRHVVPILPLTRAGRRWSKS